jgi:hypothetical protein
MRKNAYGLLLALVACSGATPTIASVAPTDVRDVLESPNHGAVVHAGTRFSVRLDNPLDNLVSPVGQVFGAHVVTPLLAASGEVVVPVGAELRGRVDGTNVHAPFLRVEFDVLRTVSGPTSLSAGISAAQFLEHKDLVRFPSAPPGQPDVERFVDTFRMPNDTRYVNPGAYYEPSYVTEISLPRNAILELVLTRPLAVPRARGAS